ncbi:MAG: Gfo/Idh/MocA family oxidoreductase [Candidatus Latescibacteria bacterium]|jgi:2-hydroxy-4-carboxymuconate semialdehyde hemiacetal dehydrogenase|nr:Gfo/Idh/MocA family oxidoreductase [Candidatus Latescibacterota bacterium]MBT4140589.1 Gfo/Idh/MocA family oxidoreductase [Candidatus Latescibacterota bacterium]MBT5830475.1 Gfo/Idh/MocA family oxidoreductase [Candidatus Latescibacterota bacterium]
MDTLSCCVVGYGGIADFHVEALKQMDGIKLHTVMGRRSEPAEAFRVKHGFEKATTNYDAVMADKTIDAVIIGSPSEVHYEQTIKALEAGKHVLVEIPLALSHKGARDLAGMATKSTAKLMVAHTRRFDPAGIFLKDFVTSGKPGRILQHQHYSFWLRHHNVGWTGYQRSWTDDVVFHHGCHLVDFSRWIVGAPIRRVSGELSPLHSEIGTSLDVSLLMRYQNEAIATISLSYNASQSAKGNIFICENGTINHTGKSIVFNGETIFETDDSAESAILTQNREFIDAIREDRAPSCNANEALASLTPLQQVYEQMITLEKEAKYKRQWHV